MAIRIPAQYCKELATFSKTERAAIMFGQYGRGGGEGGGAKKKISANVVPNQTVRFVSVLT